MSITMSVPGADVLDPENDSRKNRAAARITGVGTAVSDHSYSQAELLDLCSITDARVRSVFLNSAIERRFLSLPPLAADGTLLTETQGELLDKHKRIALDMGARAVRAALDKVGLDIEDIDYLCCATTTGFLTPGISAHLIREMGIPARTSRIDVVGMGCNAGLNALNATAGWAVANPGKVAVMLCTEACSAAYVIDGSMRTAVVNSLFGDGAAAIVLVADPPDTAYAPTAVPASPGGPRILGFASHLITEAIGAMRYDWDDEHGKFSFYLDPQVPYVVGANAEQVVDRLLGNAGLRRSDISHWLVHSGGKKVIDAVRVNLGLTRYDVRHTTGVLRDYGNLSSGSFLFSYERLLAEEAAQAGDYGVLMTMGPGSTIETALVQW
ncbi:3,5-dihydroxyphenylacetyl-CoA synthase DpgA [Streptomyces sp. MUM 16J]|uniref:3,5-dihydroxyphenylacetyl-CoA synthase DpgA n=1 Tax=Streptomyces sp. MUM 16J TaxID=2791988 RepID=UPI001F047E32|nr:3,5-dihydroxyphenylacetyl-CoA synthase DpgA [Streptomyces sp. MUM 16J]MCH0561405.1 type III polyketide synthase [Streptomyces sp. MUM 16J]